MINLKRKVRFTSFGKMAIFLSIFLLFSAQNTGNNLLFLMSSCFIAAVAFFSWVAYTNLSGLQLKVELPEAVIANSKVVLRCFVSEKRNTDHFNLAFEKDFCSIIEPGDSIMLKTQFSAGERGIYQLSDFCIFSLYPFGLCLVTLFLPEQDVFVGPKPAKNVPELIEQEIGGAIQKFQSSKEGEYWMQKHYEPGEDASLINWNISARSNEEWVLTRAMNYGLPEKLFFDFAGLEGQLFEDCLEIVMSVIQRLKNAGSNAFIWAASNDGRYGWLTISENYSELVKWLAGLQTSTEIPAATGECRGIKFSELLQESL